MSPKVLSIFNNAQIFLSDEELKELALCIENKIGKPEKKTSRRESEALKAYTIEAVTENLLATQFNKKKFNDTSSN